VQPAPNRQEFERTRDLAAGCAVAPVAADGDPFACLKDGTYRLKPAGSGDQKAGQATDTPPRRGDGDAHMLDGSLDNYPELPTFLDRRKRPHGHETLEGNMPRIKPANRYLEGSRTLHLQDGLIASGASQQ
jgi:hypothetical protein